MAALLSGYGRQTFNIHGVRLVVAADEGWLRAGVREALQAFEAPVSEADAAMLLMAGAAERVNRHELCGPGDGWRGPSAVLGARCSALGPKEASLPSTEHRAPSTEFRFGAMRCYRAGERLVYTDGASTVIVE